MPQKYTIQVDAHTYKPLEAGTLVYMPARRPPQFHGKDYRLQTLEFDAALADDPTIGYQAIRVFHKVCSKLRYEDNWVNFSQIDAAREMQMHPSHFNRALAKLIQIGVITKGPRVGRTPTYRINPDYVWRGRSTAPKTKPKPTNTPLKLVKTTQTHAPADHA